MLATCTLPLFEASSHPVQSLSTVTSCFTGYAPLHTVSHQTENKMTTVKGLRERFRDGESVICAEGYMWELERRGFVRAGVFTPEVVLDYPERVISLHEEYVHAGSDVVEAYTYYGHREKLKVIGRECELETLNLNSLKMARDVANKHGKLMAGNLSNTTTFKPNDPEAAEIARQAFKEQVEWAVKGGADYMIAETFNDLEEAIIALEVIKKYGKGMPAVITLVIYSPDRTTDDVPVPEALRRLEELGADCVGLNCGRGPETMLPLLREARKVCKGPMAALPVPFRTNQKEKTFQSLTDPISGEQLYPLDLDCVQCSRSDIRKFAQEARDLGIQYLGLCCGSSSKALREVAEALGRKPPASVYTPDLDKSFVMGKSVEGHAKKVREFMLGETKP
ncbi:betaine--homocysteine S-methyltransferase 1-like [Elysia marginata]|uniref:Betaine--homocysteine S-methyltransferase 1-like n=2 Tax=Elysia marginata TaxID=1093978 RepID=A0AAV4J5C6_9GAST|nr:betaine--homocysteine S-methyltransferase 1-like [Elysia marginata]